MYKWLILPVFLVLAACTTPEQRLAKQIDECKTLGFSTGTPEMSNCLLTLRAARLQGMYANSSSGAIVGGAIVSGAIIDSR